MKKVGIDSLSYYVPSLYVDIEELAVKRDISAEKLIKGLGLKKMATPDYDEDSASIAANSLFRLIKENNINPTEVGRVYLGTESGVMHLNLHHHMSLRFLKKYLLKTMVRDVLRIVILLISPLHVQVLLMPCKTAVTG
jgi:hydroxymethylglutaryl-CoA synthase